MTAKKWPTVAFFATVQQWRDEARERLVAVEDQNSNMAGAYLGQVEAYDAVLELLTSHAAPEVPGEATVKEDEDSNES